MLEANWKNCSKEVRIIYPGAHGRNIDEKEFHCSYLKWVEDQHVNHDDECVPEDPGIHVTRIHACMLYGARIFIIHIHWYMNTTSCCVYTAVESQTSGLAHAHSVIRSCMC